MANDQETNFLRTNLEKTTNFDYANSKIKFYKILNKYLDSRADDPSINLLMNFPYYRYKIDLIICCLQSSRKTGSKYAQVLKKSNYEKLSKKFEVSNVQNQLVLTVRTEGPQIIEVIAVEDCYEPLIEIHLKGNHKKNKELIKLLIDNYYIPSIYLDFVSDSCNVCWAKQGNNLQFNEYLNQTTLKNYGNIWEIYIMPMLKKDYDFSYVLIYLNKFNGYCFLRPLLTEAGYEVALELLKIFLDFGPPKFIYYSSSYTYLPSFSNILKTVESVKPEFRGIVFETVICPSNEVMTVINKIDDWIRNAVSPNWAIGCHLLQLDLNTSTEISDQIPFYDMFPNNKINNKINVRDDVAEIKTEVETIDLSE